MRTIAVTNQKGGVGKTTTVANLGAALAARGVNVCLIDLDPQAHLTMHFGIDPSGPSTSVYDVLTAEAPLGSAAVLVETHLTVIPSTIDLAGAEVELASAVGREQLLRDRMLAEKLPYEMVLVDCAPSLGLLTLNALAAVDEVVIPLQPHFLALQGLGKLLETVSLVQRRINPRLTVSGVVLCMYESATRLAGEVTADVEQFIASSRGKSLPWSDARIFRTRIRRNIKLAECPGYGTTIIHYDPSSHGAEDYTALAEEFCLATRPAEGADRPADADAPAPAESDAPSAADDQAAAALHSSEAVSAESEPTRGETAAAASDGAAATAEVVHTLSEAPPPDESAPPALVGDDAAAAPAESDVSSGEPLSVESNVPSGGHESAAGETNPAREGEPA